MMDEAYRYLLDMNGFSHQAGREGQGFFCNFRAEKQHGKVSYAIVLSDKYGKRILGFDNSHGYDHEHPPKVGKPYDFSTSERLVADFYERVDKYFGGDK